MSSKFPQSAQFPQQNEAMKEPAQQPRSWTEKIAMVLLGVAVIGAAMAQMIETLDTLM